MEIGTQRELTSRQINIFGPDLLSSQVPMSLPRLERVKTSESLVYAWYYAWYIFFANLYTFQGYQDELQNPAQLFGIDLIPTVERVVMKQYSEEGA